MNKAYLIKYRKEIRSLQRDRINDAYHLLVGCLSAGFLSDKEVGIAQDCADNIMLLWEEMEYDD